MPNEASEVKISIPSELIRATVIQEMINKTGDPAELFAKLVVEVLNQQTDRYDKTTLWEKLLKDMVTQAARDVVQEAWEENKEKIKKRIKKKLDADALAEALVEGCASAMKSSYSLFVTFKSPESD